jgi:hypothetical protein
MGRQFRGVIERARGEEEDIDEHECADASAVEKLRKFCVDSGSGVPPCSSSLPNGSYPQQFRGEAGEGEGLHADVAGEDELSHSVRKAVDFVPARGGILGRR